MTKTIPSVPVIVAAANRKGMVAASESPKTASSTASAIGKAIDSPRRRSLLKIGSRSDWIAGCPDTYASTPGGGRRAQRLPDRARMSLRVGEAEPREDVAVDD